MVHVQVCLRVDVHGRCDGGSGGVWTSFGCGGGAFDLGGHMEDAMLRPPCRTLMIVVEKLTGSAKDNWVWVGVGGSISLDATRRALI